MWTTRSISPTFGFNSNLVRLKPATQGIGPETELSFNSNLVRLKPRRETLRNSGQLFQFQSGTIKAVGDGGGGIDVLPFQFQSGTIKALKNTRSTVCTLTFQFQSGTIKALRRCAPVVGCVQFQFQSGTIKANASKEYFDALLTVSIPIWYD